MNRKNTAKDFLKLAGKATFLRVDLPSMVRRLKTENPSLHNAIWNAAIEEAAAAFEKDASGRWSPGDIAKGLRMLKKNSPS